MKKCVDGEVEVDISQSIFQYAVKGEDRPLVCDEKTNVEVDDKVVRICGRVEASRSMSRSSPGSGSDLGRGGDRS